MAKLVCVLALFASSAVLSANAGNLRVQSQSFPEPSSDVTVFKNEIAHNPTVSIVPPGNAPAYIVSPLRVNLPFDPLVFPNIAQVPSNAIVKSPPLRLVQKGPEIPSVSYGSIMKEVMSSYGVPNGRSSEESH